MTADRRYDYLIVGAGLYGAALARALTDHGRRVLVVERRAHIAGCAYTEVRGGICVHMYGPHIFHTDDERVWLFASRYAKFREFINQPAAVYHGEKFSLPFNMNTFNELWGVTEAEQAKRIIRAQAEAAGCSRRCCAADEAGSSGACYEASSDGAEPGSLEEAAIGQVGTEIYEKLIRGYTEKQWGRPCSELPASIITRIPVRYEYNNNYYDDRYQGIPEEGYTAMVSRMLDGIDVMTGTDYLAPAVREGLDEACSRIIYTGQIDEYYGYCYGSLGYRGLRFEHEVIAREELQQKGYGGEYFQDRAVINYTDIDTPWTRIIEHKHFAADRVRSDASQGATVITYEYPSEWSIGDEAFYPVRDRASCECYERYRQLADADDRVIFGGRLGSYRYYDMDDALAAALELADQLLSEETGAF